MGYELCDRYRVWLFIELFQSTLIFYCIGEARYNTRVEGVCRKAVCNAYGISHNMIDKAAKNVKNNVRVDEREYDDKTRANEAFIHNMRRVAELHVLELMWVHNS